ncbi:MAG: ABC transporter ATP-binding protein, partial [Fusobacteriaceae bacterium]
MQYLKIKNVNKNFGEFQALKNIEFNIEKGEFICFLGPSGCGKTTLLRILAGLEGTDSGEIFLGDENITEKHPSKRNMAIVFQSYALFPNLTVSQNIAYGLINKKLPKDKIEEKIRESVAMVGLTGKEEHYPNELSGGQQQRVALARGIAYSPDILLLDEPLSALDAKVREKLRNDIKELQKRLGITTIMVTHDQEEALSMADRILVMKDGEVLQLGTPEEIYNNPADHFVGEFIGKMNKFKIGDKMINARPEDIMLSENTLEENFVGTIQSWEYMGSYYRVTVKKGEYLIYVDISASEIKKIKLEKNNHIFLKLSEKGW